MLCAVPAAVIASVLVVSSPSSSAAGDDAGRTAAGRVPDVKFEKFTLSNGLDVILHEDHSTPIVAVNIWYHVGSKNERRGRTGFAHLFEHMMFQGSEHHDHEYFAPLQEAGGKLNGSTSDDRTNYWQVVPTNYLELALWLESDRMGFLLPAMTQAKLDNQRDVVKNERRQSYENRPYGLAFETLAAVMYPSDHPYSWPTIGSMDDLTAASREDIAAFFRRFYHPANASLCIAGDFDPAAARRLVEKYFGSIPAGPKVEKMKPWVPELAEPKRLKLEDRVSLPRIYLNWHTPPGHAADDAELDLLAAVLGSGRSSRLYRSLVREKQIAQDVSCSQLSQEIAGSFLITATARPGKSLAEIEAAINDEIARIQTEPPTPEELERAVNGYEVGFVNGFESVGGFGGKADRLNQYNVLHGDPGAYRADFERYLKVTPADVERVAKKYLTEKRVALEIVPVSTVERGASSVERQKKNSEAATPAQNKNPATSDSASSPHRSTLNASTPTFDRNAMPKPGATPKFELPPIHRAKLPNGLDLVVVEHNELPTVNMNLVVRFGSAANPPDKLGLAGLVAAVLDEGTEKRSATQIADELSGLGATLAVGTGWDTTTVRLFSLKRHLAKALDVYSDVLLNPTFPAEELDRQRSLALGHLTRMRDEPNALATLAVGATLYGELHPYGRSSSGSESSLKTITREDLRRAYDAHFRPDRATLIVVGDVRTAEITEQLEGYLKNWKSTSATAPNVSFPKPPTAAATGITLIDKPGAAQSVIAVAQIGTDRNSPDYFPLLVLNTVFGGQFSSRLNMNLRENKGYTYGARSAFDWREQPGPFEARASVQTAVTAPALAEFLKEYRDIAGGKPVEGKELEFCKAYITRGFPSNFETPRDIASRLEDLVEYGLADNYFNTVLPGVSSVSADDVSRVAKKYVDPERLAIVVVGDRSQVESALRELPQRESIETKQFDPQFRLVPLKK